MITVIGKKLRKLRIDHDERIFDMAQRLKQSSSFISAVELGKRATPANFVRLIAEEYGLTEAEREELDIAADKSRKEFRIKPQQENERDTVGLLARRMSSLTDQDHRRIQNILKGKNDHD